MDFSYLYYADEELATVLLPTLISGISSCGVNLLVYVFTALSLYSIAKRRELKNPWLSWIPVVNVWILGSIADQYRYVAKGQHKAKRKVLIVLNILTWVISLAMMIIATVMLVDIIQSAMMNLDEDMILESMMGYVLGILGMCVPLIGIVIAQAIIYYMALYDLYSSCDPQNKTLFLVIGILVSITQPIFLFLCRNKDLGMPPKRVIPAQAGYQAPQYQNQYQAPQYQNQYQAPQYQNQYQAPQYQNQYQAPQQPLYQEPSDPQNP